jgi:hypothetical protein
MRISTALAMVAALLAASCSPDPEVAAPASSCATEFRIDPKKLDQCIDVCIKCDHGTRATCSMSCTLKGAR